MSQAAVFEDSYAQQRLFSRLAMFFGLLAALLVGIGLYGTLSYRISQRSTEIGVRMALGARRWQVLRMVMRESLWIAAAGVALGIPLAMLTGHFMESMLYGLKPYDRWTALASLVGVVAIGSSSGISAGAAGGVDESDAGSAERMKSARRFCGFLAESQWRACAPWRCYAMNYLAISSRTGCCGAAKKARETRPPTMPPAMGATQKSQSCESAHAAWTKAP